MRGRIQASSVSVSTTRRAGAPRALAGLRQVGLEQRLQRLQAAGQGEAAGQLEGEFVAFGPGYR